ncbi:hypothetical protein MPDQ_000778 [Monascus purpureus]|uniref:Translation initiation factor 5A-like N-terminal domain-containing protein n=1 Tax=Monascus purpureus TaxID=5098 RepID=A0A507QQV7_MONPU|nr:hypothetical protein MPDQ_000778 [Monascus purpureus]
MDAWYGKIGVRDGMGLVWHSRKDAQRTVNLDFDARVPIPFSVFPSSYRSDAVSETTTLTERVEGEAKFDRTSRVEREDTRITTSLPDSQVYGKEEVDIRYRPAAANTYNQAQAQVQAPSSYERFSEKRYPEVDLARESYRQSNTAVAREEAPAVYDQALSNQLDITEREYRRRTNPTYDVNVSHDSRYQSTVDDSFDDYKSRTLDVSYSRGFQSQTEDEYRDNTNTYTYDRSYKPLPAVESYRPTSYARKEIDTVTTSAPRNTYYPSPASQTTTVQSTVKEEAPARKMGYYDDEGHYHSFRRGVERVAKSIVHPHEEEEIVVSEGGPARYRDGLREDVRIVEPRGGSNAETVPIPCHFIRIGDILILQGRPCQVIRISVSPQTGQHRYLGVDLFTRQLQEESSFVSNPSPSVVVQTMLGPVYKTYRILDLRDDGKIVAMTETGDVKQGLSVITQGNLFKRIRNAFSEGRGSVRALVINDGGRELVVDFKVIHGSRL